ncbi:MAG TPA: glucose-6-phosphate isomerase, partial [Bacillota bacterium]|nr:glucose-6-phosphate isomerase [Bacillota bacterium]
MTHITFSYEHAQTFINKDEISHLEPFIHAAHDMLHEKTGSGNDFLGWLNASTTLSQDEYLKIKQTAKKVKQNTDILLVIGIGGSYLGAKAATEMLTHTFSHLLET